MTINVKIKAIIGFSNFALCGMINNISLNRKTKLYMTPV